MPDITVGTWDLWVNKTRIPALWSLYSRQEKNKQNKKQKNTSYTMYVISYRVLGVLYGMEKKRESWRGLREVKIIQGSAWSEYKQGSPRRPYWKDDLLAKIWGHERVSHAAVWDKSFLGRSRHCNGSYSKVKLSGNMKDASAPIAGWTRRIIGAEFREAREERQIIRTVCTSTAQTLVHTAPEACSIYRSLRPTLRGSHPEALQ